MDLTAVRVWRGVWGGPDYRIAMKTWLDLARSVLLQQPWIWWPTLATALAKDRNPSKQDEHKKTDVHLAVVLDVSVIPPSSFL